MRQTCIIHLEGEPFNATKRFAMTKYFLCYFFGATYYNSAAGAGLCIELGPGNRRPAALLAYAGKHFGIAGEVGIDGVLCATCYKTEGMEAYFQFSGRMAGFGAGFPVKINEGAETMGFTADDGNHERKPEGACARK